MSDFKDAHIIRVLFYHKKLQNIPNYINELVEFETHFQHRIPSRCYLNGKISAIFVHVRLRSNAMLIKELHLSRLQDLKMAVNHMHG